MWAKSGIGSDMSAKLFLNRHNDGLAIQAISPPPARVVLPESPMALGEIQTVT